MAEAALGKIESLKGFVWLSHCHSRPKSSYLLARTGFSCHHIIDATLVYGQTILPPSSVKHCTFLYYRQSSYGCNYFRNHLVHQTTNPITCCIYLLIIWDISPYSLFLNSWMPDQGMEVCWDSEECILGRGDRKQKGRSIQSYQ